MTIDQLLVMWINASASRAPNGWKNSGIEFRIMREAGLTTEPNARDPDGVGETMVKVAEAVSVIYPDEVHAVYAWAKGGFKVSVVKRLFKVETRRAHLLIQSGKDLMHAGYIVLESRSYVSKGRRVID